MWRIAMMVFCQVLFRTHVEELQGEGGRGTYV